MTVPNPVLSRLGLSARDRAVVLHADDIGNFQGTLDAYRDLLEAGVISAAAVMVTCPWFPATAAFCRANANHPNLDMGVHLTLTSEYSAYRWGPVTANDQANSLRDENGYLPATSAALQRQAPAEAVGAEIQAQIDRALAAGIDVTHIDSHMGTLFHPKYIDAYVDLACEYRVPAFLPRGLDLHLFEEAHASLLAGIPEWEERGLPLFDYVTMMPLLENAQDRKEKLLRTLHDLPPGLTYLLVHPTKDTPELREASPIDWPCRAADYELLRDPATREAMRSAGVHLVTMRALRDIMRAGQTL